MLTRLTKREKEVCNLILEGLANKEIAYRLGLSESTVKLHVFGIFNCLGIRNRSSIIAKLLKAKNEELQMKLNIAVKALKRYADETRWNACQIDTLENGVCVDYDSHYSSYGYMGAQEALRQIKE